MSLTPLTFEIVYDNIAFTRVANCGKNEVVLSATTSMSNPGVTLSWSGGAFKVSGTYKNIFPKSTWTYLPLNGKLEKVTTTTPPLQPPAIPEPTVMTGNLNIRDTEGLLVTDANRDVYVESTDMITITGEQYGPGSIVDYVSGTSYYILTPEHHWTAFRLSKTPNGDPIQTVPGNVYGLALSVIREGKPVVIGSVIDTKKTELKTITIELTNIQEDPEHNWFGWFKCDPMPVDFVVGQEVTLSGTFTGTSFLGLGPISYKDTPTTYYVIDFLRSSNFQLGSKNKSPLVSGPGTYTGVTFSTTIQVPVDYSAGTTETAATPAATETTFTTITINNVMISTVGSFSCKAIKTDFVAGQEVVVSGLLNGTGSIHDYTDPKTYFVIDGVGATAFQLSTEKNGKPINTEAGTSSGLTFMVKIYNTASTATDTTTASTTDTTTTETTFSTETINNVAIGETGTFTCKPIKTDFAVGQEIVVSGLINGTGLINDYVNPSTYFVIESAGTSSFQLSTEKNGKPINTEAGTSSGLTFMVKIYDTAGGTTTKSTSTAAASTTAMVVKPITVDDFKKVPAKIAAFVESTHEPGIFKPVTYTVNTKETITTTTTTTDDKGKKTTTTTVTYQNHTYTISHKVCNNWDIYKSQVKDIIKRGSL